MDGNGISETGSPVTLHGLGEKRKEIPKGIEKHVMKRISLFLGLVAKSCSRSLRNEDPGTLSCCREWAGERDMAWTGASGG